MKKSTKTIFCLVLIAAMTASCDVSDMRTTYTPDNDGVSFVQSAITANQLLSGTETYSIDIARGVADGELTVNLTSSIYNSSDTEHMNELSAFFGVPSSVTFAPGEYVTEITLEVGQMAIGESYTGTIAIAENQECCNPSSAITSVALSLAMDYNWQEIGEGQWFDGFMLSTSTDLNIQRCRMTKAEGFEIYRLYDPWPSAEVSEAWGSDLTAGNNVPEYIQFSIGESGSIDWMHDVMTYGTMEIPGTRTGYIYNGWGGELYYVSPELFSQQDQTGVMDENLLCFNYGVFSPESDGSGWVASAYLALPGFPGNLEDLFE